MTQVRFSEKQKSEMRGRLITSAIRMRALKSKLTVCDDNDEREWLQQEFDRELRKKDNIDEQLNGINSHEIRISGSFKSADGFVILGNRNGFLKYYVGAYYDNCSVKPRAAHIFKTRADAEERVRLLELRNTLTDCVILSVKDVKLYIESLINAE